MLKPVLVTAPADGVLDIESVKEHILLDQDDNDALVQGLVSAAIAHFDGYDGVLGQCLVSQTWKQSWSCWPDGSRLRLPIAPVVSIDSVKYQDSADVEQTLDVASYSLLEDALSPYVRFDDDITLPAVKDRDDAITVQFVCGFGDPEDVPQPIKQAMLLLIGTWYRNRESVTVGGSAVILPDTVQRLIEPYRRIGP